MILITSLKKQIPSSLIALFLLQSNQHAFSEDDVTSGMVINSESKADLQARMAWWKEARFGMFVHWGLYSSAEGEWGKKKYTSGAEWVQKKANISPSLYAKTMIPKFKPSADFSSEWAKLAKRAGAKYVVFTNKHHDGFALHDSAQTEYDAKDVTGRDLHKEIVESIRKEGLRVGVYHSLWDWHHPDAPAGQNTVNLKVATMEGRDLSRYIDYLHAQVNEVTDGRYGAVDVLWLDFSTKKFQGDDWRAKELATLVRKNQPNALINNRLWHKSKKWSEQKNSNGTAKYWCGDFSTPEQHIPATGLPGVDWETCDTLNVTWGWSKHATQYKSSKELIHRLVETVSKGGNYLLNIGPMPDGSVDSKAIERFEAIGEWMQVNGEAIYGTQAGPFTKLPWGCATSKKMKNGTYRLYLHVFDWPKNGELHVPILEAKPSSCNIIDGNNNQPVEFTQTQGKLTLKGLPEKPVHSAATVIAINLDHAPKVGTYRIWASTDGSFTLEPSDATPKNGVKYNRNTMMKSSRLNNWKPGGVALYPLQVDVASRYSIEIRVVADRPEAGNEFSISIGETKVKFTLKSKGGENRWGNQHAGTIKLPAGAVTLELRGLNKEGVNASAFSTITLKRLD